MRRTVLVGILVIAAAACNDNHPLPTSFLPTLSCSAPAPVDGTSDPAAPGYIVVYHDSVDVTAETSRLSTKYHFTPTHVYQCALRGFSAELPDLTVAALRCESSIAHISHNAAVHGDVRALSN